MSSAAHDGSVVFVLANHKGGCAKTTTTANLGAAFALRGLRTLLIDADPQANLSEAFGIEPRHAGLRLEQLLADPTLPAGAWTSRPEPDGTEVFAGGVQLLPCSEALQAAVTAHLRDPRFALRLAELVGTLRPAYDVVLLDTPPGLGPLSSMAMLAGDWVIAPARPADFDVGGAVKLAELIEAQLRHANERLELLGVLVTQVDRRWTLAHEPRAALQEAGIQKLRTEIPFRVRVGAAPRHGAPTVVLEPYNPVSAAYHQLADDLAATLVAPSRAVS